MQIYRHYFQVLLFLIMLLHRVFLNTYLYELIFISFIHQTMTPACAVGWGRFALPWLSQKLEHAEILQLRSDTHRRSECTVCCWLWHMRVGTIKIYTTTKNSQTMLCDFSGGGVYHVAAPGSKRPPPKKSHQTICDFLFLCDYACDNYRYLQQNQKMSVKCL